MKAAGQQLGDETPVLEQADLADRVRVAVELDALVGVGDVPVLAVLGVEVQTGSIPVAASGARRQLIQSYPAACTALKVFKSARRGRTPRPAGPGCHRRQRPGGRRSAG